MQVDGTLHYLKMLEVIAAFGVLYFLKIISQFTRRHGVRSKSAEAGGKGANRTIGWG